MEENELQLKNGEKEKVVVLLDNSGSMDMSFGNSPKSRLQCAAEAAEAIISNSDEKTTEYAILCFSSDVILLQPMTNNFLEAISNCYPPHHGGSTQMDMGLNGSIGQSPNRIIMLTDGAPTCPEDYIWQAVQTAVNLKIKIDTVAIGAADDKLLKEISARTGGIFRRCDDPQQLINTFIALETKNRLMLEHQV